MSGLVENFVRESNRIEGITREPTRNEVSATVDFLNIPLTHLTIQHVIDLVNVYQPDAVLRDKEGLDVRVGNHIPPSGNPTIRQALALIVTDAKLDQNHPFVHHREYETLHPFTDGNGRSGRALWAWQMLHHDYDPGIQLGFLHAWYYQSLSFGDIGR